MYSKIFHAQASFNKSHKSSVKSPHGALFISRPLKRRGGGYKNKNMPFITQIRKIVTIKSSCGRQITQTYAGTLNQH